MISAGLAALYAIKPEWKPYVTTTKRADLRVLAVDRGVTRDQWRWRVANGDMKKRNALVTADAKVLKAPRDEACTVHGKQAGYVAYIRSTAEGFKRRELNVRMALYAYPSRQRLESTVAEEYRTLASVPVDAPTDSSVQEVWIYDPVAARRYFLRAGFYDDGVLLAVADSKPFLALTDAELHALRTLKARPC